MTGLPYSWRRSSGFTLIELLVVIAIIGVVAAMSIAFLSVFNRGQSVKEGARIIQAAFAEARQLAAAKRQMHFIHFPKSAAGSYDRVTFYVDTDVVLNNKGVCNGPGGGTPGDTRYDREIMLPRGVEFSDGNPPANSIFNSPPPPNSLWPYLGFRPDGTIALMPPVGDKNLNDPAKLQTASLACQNADLIIYNRQPGVATKPPGTGPEFVAMDVVMETGKIRKIQFFNGQ